MQVRPNHYIGAGHHHADAGMFYFSGTGVNWITETSFNSYDGRLHNEVLIDGISEANGTPARARYLGAELAKDANFASADLTYAYSWEWTTQVQTWNHTWPPHDPEPARWELEPASDIIAIFQGTQRYKNRIWWDTYNYANWIPTLRAPWNPVQYAFRTSGLIRGKHPYAVIADDLKKDSAEHLYQWTAVLPEEMIPVSIPGTAPGDLTIVRKVDAPAVGKLKPGTPLLLIHPSGTASGLKPRIESAYDGPKDNKGVAGKYSRLVIDYKVVEYHERMLLIPFRFGEPLPTLTDSATGVRLSWPDGENALRFNLGDDHRTTVTAEAVARASR